MYAEYYHNRIYTSYSFLLGIQNKRSVKYWLIFLIPPLKGAGSRGQGDVSPFEGGINLQNPDMV